MTFNAVHDSSLLVAFFFFFEYDLCRRLRSDADSL